MMDRCQCEPACSGEACSIEWAYWSQRNQQIDQFNRLPVRERKRLNVVAQMLSKVGSLAGEKMHALHPHDQGIWELKGIDHRIAMFREGKKWWMTHPFKKGTNRHATAQVPIAVRAREEHRKSLKPC